MRHNLSNHLILFALMCSHIYETEIVTLTTRCSV